MPQELHPRPGADLLRTIVEQVGEGLVAVDQQGQFIVWNPAATTLLGSGPIVCEPERWPELYGLFSVDENRLLEMNELPLLNALLHQQLDEREMIVRNQPYPHGRRIRVRARPIFDSQGEPCGALSQFVDVTDSHLHALTQQMMVGFFESTQDAIINIDPQGAILSWNPGAAAMFGYTVEEALGQQISLLAPPPLADELPKLFERLNRGKTIARTYVFGRRKDGSTVECARSVTPIRTQDGRLLGCATILTDVTKWRQAERELMSSQEQLRLLSARLQTAQEHELNRISRELHDELGQLLTGLKLDLAWLDEKLAPSRPDLSGRVAEMNQLLDQTMQSVRRLATQMRPQLLEALGLPAALQRLLDHAAGRANFRCRLTVPSSVEKRLSLLPADELTALYRICQEALTNASKYSQASEVQVELSDDGVHLLMCIRDNGQGADPDELGRTRGLGLVGMRERAHIWGGRLEIESVLGQGLQLQVLLPWSGV